MLPFLLAAVLLFPQSPPRPATNRAAAEQFLNRRMATCSASPADLEAWPGGEQVAVTTDILFVQQVDEELLQEQQKATRDLIGGVLQPLGIRTSPDDSERAAAIAFTGVAEALTAPGAASGTVFNGTWWRGSISLQLRGRCLFSRPFQARVQPSDGPRVIAVASPSDAPFLDGLEPAFIGALIATAETIRGQAGLARIANSDTDSRACLLALDRITDQAMLTGLARAGKAPWLRVPAVARLLDVNRLAAIAKTDSNPDVRQAALARIAELTRKNDQTTVDSRQSTVHR